MAEAEDSSGEQEAASSKPLFEGLSDVSISQDIPIEGEITIPTRARAQECDSSTLNESIRQTIMRDLKAVGRKFMHVLYPRKSNALLRDWDLWGPLILCVTLAFSFFQSLCVLGYCILPLNIAMLICRLLLLAGQGPINFMIRLFVVLVMFAWSVIASTAFLADSQPPNRKALAVYPVFLFCFVISWMILTFTP